MAKKNIFIAHFPLKYYFCANSAEWVSESNKFTKYLYSRAQNMDKNIKVKVYIMDKNE